MHPHRRDAVSRDWLLDTRLRCWLNALTGRDPYAVQTMFYFKPPGARGQALHQDQRTLRVRPGTCLAAWMAVDRCDTENGCLQVVPGTHKLPVLCTETADLELSFTDFTVPVPADLTPEDVMMEQGDVLFFNGQLIHDRLLDQFRGLIDYRAAVQTWRRALGSHWEGSPVWVHGDVAPGNLLVRDGQLHAVIDFGQFAAGDPSCDLTVAWTLLDEAGRAVFRSRLQLDDLVWQRARGWALWKQLLDLESALSLRNGSARRVHDVLQVIGEISAPPD